MPEKITKKAVDALRAKAKKEGKTCYLFDSEFRGFGAVATKTGSCSYFVEYRLRGAGGSPKRVTLGKPMLGCHRQRSGPARRAGMPGAPRVGVVVVSRMRHGAVHQRRQCRRGGAAEKHLRLAAGMPRRRRTPHRQRPRFLVRSERDAEIV